MQKSFEIKTNKIRTRRLSLGAHAKKDYANRRGTSEGVDYKTRQRFPDDDKTWFDFMQTMKNNHFTSLKSNGTLWFFKTCMVIQIMFRRYLIQNGNLHI